MTHLILWVFLALLAVVGSFFGVCSTHAAVIWTCATLVALALHSLFGEEA